MAPIYIMIEQEETGRNIQHLMKEKGLKVRDIQMACGFEQPQAIYKWLNGQSLPSIDNLLILTRLLSTTVEGILVTSEDALPRLPMCVRQIWTWYSFDGRERYWLKTIIRSRVFRCFDRSSCM